MDVLELPFNTGISVGRNAGVAATETEFCLITDDDTVFSRASNLHLLLSYLRDNPEVDIACLLLVNLPQRKFVDSREDDLYAGADPPLRDYDDLIGGMPVRYMVPNVFMARTEALRQVMWDEDLPLVEHTDFFSRASGKLVSVIFTHAVCYHAQTPFDQHYVSYRRNVGEYLHRAQHKWAAIAAAKAREGKN